MLGLPMGMGMAIAYRTSAWCLEGVKNKFQMTNSTMHNSIYSTQYALKPVPDLADVGDSQWYMLRSIQQTTAIVETTTIVE